MYSTEQRCKSGGRFYTHTRRTWANKPSHYSSFAFLRLPARFPRDLPRNLCRVFLILAFLRVMSYPVAVVVQPGIIPGKYLQFFFVLKTGDIRTNYSQINVDDTTAELRRLSAWSWISHDPRQDQNPPGWSRERNMKEHFQRKEMLEIITDWETNNKYIIRNEQGEQVE